MKKNTFKYLATFIPALVVFCFFYFAMNSRSTTGNAGWNIYIIFLLGIFPLMLLTLVVMLFIFMFKAFRKGAKGSTLLRQIFFFLTFALSMVLAIALLNVLA